MASDLATQAQAWHTQQRTRATSYKIPKPEIPGNYRCAGDCSAPPPPLPPGTTNEAFAATVTHSVPRTWWVIMSVAAFSYAAIALTSSKGYNRIRQ